MEKRYEELLNLLKNESVMIKLFQLSPEDVVDTLKNEYHLDFTLDEIQEFAKGMKQAINDDTSDELSEESLEQVAGGGKDSISYKVGYYSGKVVKAIKAIGKLVIDLGW